MSIPLVAVVDSQQFRLATLSQVKQGHTALKATKSQPLGVRRESHGGIARELTVSVDQPPHCAREVFVSGLGWNLSSIQRAERVM